MKLSTPVKIIVGLATALELIAPLLFIPVWLAMMSNMSSMSTSADPDLLFNEFSGLWSIMFPLICVLSVVNMALIAFYLVHVIRNDKGADIVRIILALGIFFMPYVAMPVYYIIYILMDPPPTWAMATGSKP